MRNKKFLPLAVALLAVLLFLFAACTDDTKEPDNSSNSDAAVDTESSVENSESSSAITDTDTTDQPDGTEETERPDDSSDTDTTDQPENTEETTRPEVSSDTDTTDQPNDTEETERPEDSSDTDTTDQPEDTEETTRPEDSSDTDEPSYDEMPPCDTYWYYDPTGEIGKLVKVSHDEKGNIHLIEKYPLFSEFLYSDTIAGFDVSLSDIAYNDPFGIATEKVVFNYRKGTLVSADYYAIPKNHLGDRTYEKGYSMIFEESDVQSSFKSITAYIYANGYKTALEETYIYDSVNNEITRRDVFATSDELVYDASGRLIAIRGNRDGTSMTYGQDGNISSYQYYVVGTGVKEMLFTFTDGMLTALTYTNEEETNAATLFYENGRFVRAEITYTNTANPDMNANGTSSVTYDASGRVSEIVIANARDGITSTRSYTYTAEGYFATVREVESYSYTTEDCELLFFNLTYENGKPISVSQTTRLGTYTADITYDAFGNMTYDGIYTYEYYASGQLKKKSNQNGYVIYYENGLPKESKYPGIERSTVINYFDEIPFNFVFKSTDLYFGSQNETSAILYYAKRTVHTAADGTVTEYIRTFDENFNLIDTVTTVTPPSGEEPTDPPSQDDPPTTDHTHTYTRSEITTPATCETDGELTKYCSCGNTVTQTIKAQGHKYYSEDIVTEPTCTSPGEKKLSCSCGDFITEEIKPIGHDYYDERVTREPTCDKAGELSFFCDCGDSVTEEIEALGHDIIDETVTLEPTCVESGVLTQYCSIGCTVTVDIEAIGHDFHDWSVFTEPTCVTEGVLIRSCETCYAIEYDDAPVISHNFTKIDEDATEHGEVFVTLVCEMCNTPAGQTYRGSYLDTNDMFYLSCQPTDFSFDVLTECDADTVKKSVIIVPVYFINNSIEEIRENAIEITVTEMDSGRYTISPKESLDQNSSYVILFDTCDAPISFLDMPGYSAVFDTAGDASSNIEYNENILFLKALAQENGIEYAYSLEYNYDYDLYALALSNEYGFDESYVGRILCIGDCSGWDEVAGLNSEEVFFGKIELVVTENGVTFIGLSIPSVLDIYSNINVNGAKIENIGPEIVTEEVKASVLKTVIESDDFAAAIAAANVAATTYALDNMPSAYTAARSLEIDNFNIIPKVEKIGENAIKIVLYITYTHIIDLREGGETIGDITFSISFEISNTFTLEASTNLTEYFSDKSTPMMYMKCTLVSKTYAALDIETSINIKYSVTEEALFIVNLNSKKVHLPSCRHCPRMLTKNYAIASFAELEHNYPNYRSNECKVCRPFTLDGSTFYVNKDSMLIHIGSCVHLRDMIADNYTVYTMYPLGIGVRSCKDCLPERHTKTLAQHLGESIKNADFTEAFESVKKATGDILKAGGESPINEDTDPKIIIPLSCFEVPIYLEPRFDFSLEANFKIHSEVSITNSAMVALIYRDGEFSIISDYHRGNPVSQTTVDITGELDIEIGVITEVRFGLRYLSKYVYVGFMTDTGVYLDASGVFSYDSQDESTYYAASLELGAYAEARCTYAVIGLISSDSFYILEKTRLPVFSSGDTRVYFRYENIEESIDVLNVRKLWLDNSYLMCNYYDLKKMDLAKGSLSWSGSTQYSISCIFKDEAGNEVDYITFDKGAIIISDDAPDNFTVYMTVTVNDLIAYDTFEKYFGTSNKNGYAIFLPEKVIEIRYSYTDTTEEMQAALDVYKGTFTFGTDLFGNVFYRNLILGVHSAEELCANEGMLNTYAILATYSLRDESGNPVKVYTANDLRSIIQNLGCEYVMVFYASPGNHYFDEGYEFKILQAYWNDGLFSNSSNQMEIGNVSGNQIWLQLGIPNEEGMFGGVYDDETCEVQIGEFELFRTSKKQDD